MATTTDFPTLLHAFVHQVEEHPQRIAIVDGSRRIRYRDLARAAEQVRANLAAAGVAPGDHVGISMERSWRVVAAIVGTLAAGARYVPLDPTYPRVRIDYMAADSGLRVVCCDAGRPAMVPPGLVRIPVSGDAANRLPLPDAADLSGYIIYTSGSTGKPKGVIIPQRHVLDLFIGACSSHFSFSCEDVWSFFHSYSFDFSVWEIWGALLFGGTLVVVDDEGKRDPGRMLALLHEHRVSVLSQVPSPFRYLSMQYEVDPRPLRSLRYVVFGGEALDKPSVRNWLSRRDGPEQLINMYGITETTVHVTAKVVTPADVADDSSPTLIGVPLPHLDVALVRPDGTVAGGDEPGEMWVAGSTVSPGYVGQPTLTAERFVTRDLGSGARRWYRSGDLARRRPDGELVYLDRLDSQVNLRGFRIELGEIEAALRRSDGVRDAAAAVVALPGDERTLVAAVEPMEATAPPDGQALREICRGRLPAYMIPDRIVVVDRIPVTPGGEKIDRKKIAAMAAVATQGGPNLVHR
jgi:nonribosomal peptide synthetase DhbF